MHDRLALANPYVDVRMGANAYEKAVRERETTSLAWNNVQTDW